MKDLDKNKGELLLKIEAQKIKLAKLENISLLYEDLQNKITINEEKQNSKLQLALEILNTGVPIIIWKTSLDDQNNYSNSYISENVDELLLLPLGSIDNNWTKYLSYIEEEYRSLIINTVLEAFNNFGKFFSCDYKIKKSNGEVIWVASKGRTHSNNGVITFIGYTTEITERKMVELSLKESENRYKYLFNQSPISIWEEDYSQVFKYLNTIKEKGITDIRQYLKNNLNEVMKCSKLVKVLDVNEITLELFNAKSKKELTTNLGKVFTKDSLPMFIEQLAAIWENKFRFSQDTINKTIDGKVINVAVSHNVMPNYEKDFSRLLISLVDITEIKRAEKALKTSESKLKSIITSMNDMIFVLDKESRFVSVNAQEKDLMMKEELFIGKTHSEIMPDYIDKLFNKAMLKVRKGGHEEYEYYIKNDLCTLWFSLKISPIFEDNVFMGSVSVVRDITKRKQGEKELKKNRERMKMMNKIIRHDLTNDLIVIKSALNIYHKKSEQKMLIEAEKRINESLKTIKQYKKYEAFIDSNSMLKKIEIASLLNVIKLDYPEINIIIRGEGQILADEALISVFKNLVSNSIKHGKATRIEINIFLEKGYFKIEFKDNGIGIPDKYKSQVFDEGFHCGETGHTGIGLYIVRSTIEHYGGSISVENNIPKGTNFIISIRSVSRDSN